MTQKLKIRMIPNGKKVQINDKDDKRRWFQNKGSKTVKEEVVIEIVLREK